METSLHRKFLRFGLIVTGTGERKFLPSLFRSLMTTQECCFEIIARVDQRSPITSARKLARNTVIGTNKRIPTRDEEQIGLPARRYLGAEDRFVVLVDDLEFDRRGMVAEVFARYRLALDTVLGNSLAPRASVHFLVTMLEAYYFADPDAVKSAIEVVLEDDPGDVEQIRNPKARLKQLFPAFDEVRHGEQIVKRLDVAQVLSRPDTCASLRTLYAWCWRALGRLPDVEYQFNDGRYHEVTQPQIETLPVP